MNEDHADQQPGRSVADVIRDVLAPLLAVDGGEIELVTIVDGVAEITLRGACAGCPGQHLTTREVVLPALRAADPSILSVKVTVAVV